MKNFILGIGAQKSGTTWLHDYLVNHNQCEMGFMKEYHVLDAKFVPECKVFKERALKKFENEKDRARGESRIVQFHEDIDTYFDYFSKLSSATNVRLTGDITPSYSALPAEAFRLVLTELAKRNLSCRCVFLMRDPVERVWSSTRNWRREHLKKKDGRDDSMSEVDQLLKSYKKPRVEIRTRYENTLENIYQCFQKDHIFCGFYEDLFSESTIRRLTKFLGIDFKKPSLDIWINVSQKEHDLPEEVAEEIATYYRETYVAVADRFGADKLSSLWPYFKYVNS